jgi:hypothetical protein
VTSLPLVLTRPCWFAGFIGGSNYDKGNGIAVDAAGNIYVTGSTISDQTSFPVVAGPDLTQNGLWDAFIAKVNPAGTALIYAGYIGGVNWDEGTGVAVDGAGNAYVTGYTASDQATFPVKGGPDLTYNGNSQNGIGDAFVAKSTPPALAWSCRLIGAPIDQKRTLPWMGTNACHRNTTSDQTASR